MSIGELEAKAREINEAIYGPDRSRKRKLMEAAKEQADLSAKFALQKALSVHGISDSSKKAFVELLKERRDAVNILFASSQSEKQKATEMLKPIFGYKGMEFIEGFQSAFRQLQSEIEFEKKRHVAI